MGRHKLTIQEIMCLYPTTEYSETHFGSPYSENGFTVGYYFDDSHSSTTQEKATYLDIHIYDCYGIMIDSVLGIISK